MSDEPAWWKRMGIEPAAVARKLWESTRLALAGCSTSQRCKSAALKYDGAGGLQYRVRRAAAPEPLGHSLCA